MGTSADGFALLAGLARLLASDEERRLDAALALVADGLSVEATLTLREAGRHRSGALLATSGLTLVPAQRHPSTALLDLPLRQDGRLAAALCVVAQAPLDAADLFLLGAAADVFALAIGALLPALEDEAPLLAADTTGADTTGEVASALRDGLAGDVAVSVRAAVDASRRTGVPVRLELPAQLLPCAPLHAVTAYHVVLAALSGVRTEAVVTVAVAPSAGELVVTVTAAQDPQDRGTLARWARRATSLDGHLDRHLDGVTLVLPWSSVRSTAAASPDATPSAAPYGPSRTFEVAR